jgi:DNA-binding MarR family transcriptional regulator
LNKHEYEHRVIHLLRRLACHMYSHSRQMVRRCGLTTPQALTMQILLQTGGTTASELARQVCLSPGTLTGVLDRLEAKRLIERARNQADRRSVMVRPTAGAARLFEGDLSLLSAGFSDRFAALPEREKESILKALHRLAVMMGDTSIPSSPSKTIKDAKYSGIPLHELVNHQSDAPLERHQK